MRNKTAAGIFALFLGWAGLHRFYLGQTGYGILYLVLTICTLGIVSGIVSLIDAILLFSMDEQEFNRKYNTPRGMAPPIYNRRLEQQQQQRGYPPAAQPRQRNRSTPAPRNMQVPGRELQNPYKVNGIKKYKEFDLEGAIDDFKKGLDIHPNDISLHFNIACAYSLTEQVDKAYAHLDRAVALGFNDFEKIKTHDDLAFVRIQDRFDDFKKNGFRLDKKATIAPENNTKELQANPEPMMDDILLAQLKRLAELRDRGLLSEQEFMTEKKKLTR